LTLIMKYGLIKDIGRIMLKKKGVLIFLFIIGSRKCTFYFDCDMAIDIRLR
jgi:hypothetical protein